MIIAKQKFNVQKNGKGGRWKKGYVSISPEFCKNLNWTTQDVIVIIARPTERISYDRIVKGFAKIKKLFKIELEITKIKEDEIK